jgi:hypothetical protein
MTDALRPADRWLPWLGVALIVESALAFVPEMSPQPFLGPNDQGTGDHRWNLTVSALFLGGLGIATLILGRRTEVIPRFHGLAGFSVGVLSVLQISYAVQFIAAFRSPPAYLLFQTPSGILLSAGAALVWGSAIARREAPSSLVFQKVGRIAGGLVQLGLVFAFVQEALNSSMMGFRSFGMPGSATYGMFTLIRAAGRLLLLWCSIESVRGATEEAVILLRARRIHKLMIGWIAVMTLSALVTTILWLLTKENSFRQAPYVRYNVWRSVVSVTVALIAAFAVAKQLLGTSSSYKSGPAPHPSGGAET